MAITTTEISQRYSFGDKDCFGGRNSHKAERDLFDLAHLL